MSELLKINVNEHTEKKGKLTYLSWSWAWAEVLKIDPSANWSMQTYDGKPCMYLLDGSAMVSVAVTIKGDTKSCVLPVMNHQNKAINNPDAFAVNTAIMRCLAKAIGMHGLGLYIYAGEDLPEEENKPKVELVKKDTDDEDNAIASEFAENVVMLWNNGHIEKAFAEDADVLSRGNELYLLYWGYLKPYPAIRAALKKHREELKLKQAA